MPIPTDQTMPVLVLNAGSSSLKLERLPGGPKVSVERIGEAAGAVLNHDNKQQDLGYVADASDALGHVRKHVGQALNLDEIEAVGHRVVHGGERFKRPTIITPDIIQALESISDLAPLHNPANIAGIKAAQQALPDVPHVAVFDTAFHATMPPRSYRYAIPNELYEQHGVRKYGFHGTSHAYLARAAAERMAQPLERLKLITLHLGNGASAAAIDGGASVDTSMGMTPLDGLVMGTRSGTIDPGVLLHLLRHGYDVDTLDTLLNRSSGLLGLSGLSNDLRDVQAAMDEGNPNAHLAVDAYTYRIKTTVGAYAAALGGLDAIVFAGGVGENNPLVRARSLEGLEGLFGLGLDTQANEANNERIHALDSRIAVWVIPTHEEAMIATWTAETVREELT